MNMLGKEPDPELDEICVFSLPVGGRGGGCSRNDDDEKVMVIVPRPEDMLANLVKYRAYGRWDRVKSS
jgi:hypothetical protein